jgi:alpha-1,6-mannosyltransferase
VPRNAGHPTGDARWAWLFLGFAIAGFVAYVAAIVLLRRGGAGLRSVAVVAAAVQLTPLAAPLLLSTDAWTYWDYGRLAAVHDRNPYEAVPEDVPGDPAFPWVGSGWRREHSVYGPGFTLASEPLALAAGSSHDAAAWIYKTLAALAVLGATGLAAFLSARRALAAALVGWNPLVAFHFAGGGHNDAWMALAVVGALALGATGRRQLAGVAWAAAVTIKWVPLVLLPLRALEARARKREVGHAGFGIAAVVLFAAACARYGFHWLSAFGPLARNANHESRFSLPHRIEQIVHLPHPGGIVLCAVAFGLAYLWLLRAAARGRARLGLATGLLLLATPWLIAWYVIWALPLAAAEDDAPGQWLAIGLSGYLLRQAIPL